MKAQMKQITVKAKDFLDLVALHPFQKVCPVCSKDVMRVAMIDLVYRFKECDCPIATYTHLIQRLYHQDCYDSDRRQISELNQKVNDTNG